MSRTSPFGTWSPKVLIAVRARRRRRGFPAFYSYAYPAPPGFADASVAPKAAYFDKGLREFLLPYDTVRRSSDPAADLMAFLESTYRAAAELGAWDRQRLECARGEPRRPRPI